MCCSARFQKSSKQKAHALLSSTAASYRLSPRYCGDNSNNNNNTFQVIQYNHTTKHFTVRRPTRQNSHRPHTTHHTHSTRIPLSHLTLFLHPDTHTHPPTYTPRHTLLTTSQHIRGLQSELICRLQKSSDPPCYLRKRSPTLFSPYPPAAANQFRSSSDHSHAGQLSRRYNTPSTPPCRLRQAR